MTLSPIQLANAAALWSIVQLRGLPSGVANDRAALAVICTAFAEASLVNQLAGDAGTSSCGLFQQNAGYGPYASRMDPATSAGLFLDGGPQGQPAFLNQPYTTGTLDDLARCIQAVQGSQYDGRTIDPSTGKPFGLAANYITAMPTAVTALTLIKAAVYGPVTRQATAVTLALGPLIGVDLNAVVTGAGSHADAISRYVKVTV